jgi:hypothetical protein
MGEDGSVYSLLEHAVRLVYEDYRLRGLALEEDTAAAVDNAMDALRRRVPPPKVMPVPLAGQPGSDGEGGIG